MTNTRRHITAVAAMTISIAIALAATATPAAAQEPGAVKGTFGVGLIIGEPTGVSAKLYLSDDTAVDGAVGSAVVGGGLQVHGDYLWHPWILETRDSFVLPVYLGPGVRVLQRELGRDGDDAFHIGVRAVVGVVFDFTEIPLDVFAEVAGVADYRFGTDDEDYNGFALALNAGAGARYYF
jgi:hypothetical protein